MSILESSPADFLRAGSTCLSGRHRRRFLNLRPAVSLTAARTIDHRLRPRRLPLTHASLRSVPQRAPLITAFTSREGSRGLVTASAVAAASTEHLPHVHHLSLATPLLVPACWEARRPPISPITGNPQSGSDPYVRIRLHCLQHRAVVPRARGTGVAAGSLGERPIRPGSRRSRRSPTGTAPRGACRRPPTGRRLTFGRRHVRLIPVMHKKLAP